LCLYKENKQVWQNESPHTVIATFFGGFKIRGACRGPGFPHAVMAAFFGGAGYSATCLPFGAIEV
jgi:hypothetical protein